MSTINLKRFVNINIQPRERTSIGTRKETVLLCPHNIETTIVSSAKQAKALVADISTSAVGDYAEVFFDHGGSKLKIVGNVPVPDAGGSGSPTYTSLESAIAALPNEDIIVAYAPATATSIEGIYAGMKAVAETRRDDTSVYGINEKILLARSEVATDTDTDIKNFAVKYSTAVGAEMTIAAYLSKINVYGTDTVQDYAYTEEKIADEKVSDSTFGTLMDNNYNVDVALANATRVLGGNCKDGEEIVNNFVRIVLHQTLTDRLIQLLTEKIKGQTGISKIYATIAEELDRYKTNGYLSLDKVWTGDPLIVEDDNGHSYTIVNEGDALVNGYIVKVLPLATVPSNSQLDHPAPPVYIVIADMYSIRAITINGEII